MSKLCRDQHLRYLPHQKIATRVETNSRRRLKILNLCNSARLKSARLKKARLKSTKMHLNSCSPCCEFCNSRKHILGKFIQSLTAEGQLRLQLIKSSWYPFMIPTSCQKDRKIICNNAIEISLTLACQNWRKKRLLLLKHSEGHKKEDGSTKAVKICSEVV